MIWAGLAARLRNAQGRPVSSMVFKVDEQVEHFRRTAHRITMRSRAGGLGPELGLEHLVELIVWLSPVDPRLAFVDETLRIS
jgi:hypothetical protein